MTRGESRVRRCPSHVASDFLGGLTQVEIPRANIHDPHVQIIFHNIVPILLGLATVAAFAACKKEAA